jgi:hypothetical protein
VENIAHSLQLVSHASSIFVTSGSDDNKVGTSYLNPVFSFRVGGHANNKAKTEQRIKTAKHAHEYSKKPGQKEFSL